MSGIHPLRFSQFTLTLVSVLVVSGILLSACVGKTVQQRAGRAKGQKLERTHETLQERLAKQAAAQEQLEEEIAKLQLGLLEKEAQVRHLQKKVDEAIQEVVRTNAKLHSLESKAEAVSTIAEAEVALKALRAEAAGKAERPEVTQAEDLLKMSARELEKHNYGGALYLASQAKGLARAKGLVNTDRRQLRAGEVVFALPLSIRALAKSHVREGPGLDFKVLFTVERDAPLVGYSYEDQWVRVKAKDGRAGWIFHTLVGGRQKRGQ